MWILSKLHLLFYARPQECLQTCVVTTLTGISLWSLMTLTLGGYKMPELLWKWAANWRFRLKPVSSHAFHFLTPTRIFFPFLVTMSTNLLNNNIFDKKNIFSCYFIYLISCLTTPVVSKIQLYLVPIFATYFRKCEVIQNVHFSQNHNLFIKTNGTNRVITL